MSSLNGVHSLELDLSVAIPINKVFVATNKCSLSKKYLNRVSS